VGCLCAALEREPVDACGVQPDLTMVIYNPTTAADAEKIRSLSESSSFAVRSTATKGKTGDQ